MTEADVYGTLQGKALRSLVSCDIQAILRAEERLIRFAENDPQAVIDALIDMGQEHPGLQALLARLHAA